LDTKGLLAKLPEKDPVGLEFCSRSDRELHKTATMGLPAQIIQVGRRFRLPLGKVSGVLETKRLRSE
jgi:hypothetical protein